MAFSVKAIKGTNDVLPCDSHKYQYIEQAALDTAKSFGFLEMRTSTIVASYLEKLGYDLSEEDGSKVWEAFQKIAARKDVIPSKELDTIVASAAMQVPATYVLTSYNITASNTASSMAQMKLEKNGQALEGVALGDGPVDAAFLALENILGCHYELDDFQVRAVTEGREAMGETVIKLRSNGKLYSGRGTSTDIIGSSIQAYISAINKIVYEEA